MAKKKARTRLFEAVVGYFAQFDRVAAYASGGVLRSDDIMVLLWLEERYQSTASDIASGLALSKPRMSRSLQRLTSAELLDESVSCDDFRRLRYRLSNRGENIVFEVRKEFGVQATGEILAQYRVLQQATRQAEEQCHKTKLSDSIQRILPLSHLAGKPLAIKELARLSRLAPHRTSMAVASCEEWGWLEKRGSQEDARLQLVQLSAQGRDVAKILSDSFAR